jgi:hypothetical protein
MLCGVTVDMSGVACNLPVLNSGSVTSVTVSLEPTLLGTIIDVARAMSDTYDYDSSNNNKTITTTVE